MNTPKHKPWFYRNLPNAVSLLGVLPLALLTLVDGAWFLIPLMIYNNIMDDLDGHLAVKLDLKSDFGATLDNICDAVAHVIFVIFVGTRYDVACTALCIVAIAAILLRITSRVVPGPKRSGGSPTNELMRHIVLVLIATDTLGWSAPPFLIAVFALNAVSMLVPYPLPHLIRSQMTSTIGVAMVNAILLVAWWTPVTAPLIAVAFGVPFLYSLIIGGIGWLRRSEQ